MSKHDTARLWALAADKLPPDEAAWAEHHVSECADCSDVLEGVRSARVALTATTRSAPVVHWERVDTAVSAAIAAKALKPSFGFKLALAGVPALVAAALVAAVLWPRPPAQALEAPQGAVAQAPQPASEVTGVLRAEGLLLVGPETSVLKSGGALAHGDVVRTALAGRGFLALPDKSVVRLGGATQVALTRTAADDIALTLEQGRLAVHAAHVKRRGFVVHTQGLAVRVVGTTFSVSTTREGVEVAVSEGRVLVEPPRGETMVVEPGQRVRFDTQKWKSSQGPLSPSQQQELSEVLAVAPMEPAATPAQPLAGLVVPERAAPAALKPLRVKVSVPAAGDAAATPKVQVVAAQAPRPVLPPEASPALPPAPLPAAPLPPPPPLEPAVAQDSEWNALPAPPPPVDVGPGPMVAPRQSAVELPDDLELLFLQRAQRAYEGGQCERYLLGLEELASDSRPNAGRSEQARVLRARCFDALGRSDKAQEEYRRYLRDYAAGRYAAEAARELNRLDFDGYPR